MLTVISNTGVEIEGVFLGETELVEDTAYTIDDLEITLLKEYLGDLEEGEQKFTIATNYFNVDVVINIIDTTEEV